MSRARKIIDNQIQFRLEAESIDVLLYKLSKICIAVVATNGTDRKFQKERWQMCRMLATFADKGLVKFPIAITKDESPDFIIRDPNGLIGVECSEAVSRTEAWVRSKINEFDLNPDDPPPVFFRQPFDPDAPLPMPERIRAIASGECAGPPWMGNAAETEWAKALVHSVRKKQIDAGKPDFSHYPRNWLLIYENLPAPIQNLSDALGFLHNEIEENFSPAPFDQVFIESRDLIFDMQSRDMAPIAVRNLWKK